MKKILDGKRFDTKKANKLAEWDNLGHGADSMSDFHYCEMSLYQTPRSKQFFLSGSGGPMSRFAQSAGQNSWTGGSDIIPLTKEQAFEWAQEHLGAEEVDDLFGDMIEDA